MQVIAASSARIRRGRPQRRRARVVVAGSTGVPRGFRQACGRGLYRIFNSAGFRFFRSNSRPPLLTDSPYATSSSLPSTPAATFADGTWYISVSYFDGVLDSGFLPIGSRGETYITLVISGGAAQPNIPHLPPRARLIAMPGGVIRIVAFYTSAADAADPNASAATHWAIAYTTDGSTPASGSPSVTVPISTGGMAILAYDLPAQANGTPVKVQLQMMIAGSPNIFSLPNTVLTATASTSGPTAPLAVASSPGGGA